ncbi:MAG: hypothetical protein A3K16_03065, partial [Omnitrophica bacterium RIFCSPLOWO2_01_FULL_45_24]
MLAWQSRKNSVQKNSKSAFIQSDSISTREELGSNSLIMDWQSLRNKKWIRAIALILIICFVHQDLVWAQGGTPIWSKGSNGSFNFKPPVTPQGGVAVPKDIALTKEVFKSTAGDKTIINIQDAHASFAAQESIVSILDSLVTNYDLKLVAIEGSEGYIDTSILKTFPNEEIREKTAKYFMKKGKLSAGEFFSITSDKEIALYGIEDKPLYMENAGQFRKIRDINEATKKDISNLTANLESLKEKVYSKEMLQLDRNSVLHKDGKIGFSDRWGLINALAEKFYIKYQKHENLTKLVESLKVEKNVDFQKANKERDVLIDLLSKKMVKQDLEHLVLKSLSFKTGKVSQGEYYVYLQELASRYGVDPEPYKSLILYTDYITLYESIDLVEIFEEVKKFEDSIKEKMFENNYQRKLRYFSRFISLVSDLYELKLTNGDVDELISYIPSLRGANEVSDEAISKSEIASLAFGSLAMTGERILSAPRNDDAKVKASAEALATFIKETCLKYNAAIDGNYDLAAILDNIPAAVTFYKTAEERNSAMLANTINKMQKENQSVAALVTGGYHTKGLTKLLRQKETSYIVILPKFDSSEGERPYVAILTNKKEPYEKLLESGDYFLATTSLFASERNFKDPIDIRRFIEEMILVAMAQAKLKGQDEQSIANIWLDAFEARQKQLGIEGKQGLMTRAELNNLIKLVEIDTVKEGAASFAVVSIGQTAKGEEYKNCLKIVEAGDEIGISIPTPQELAKVKAAKEILARRRGEAVKVEAPQLAKLEERVTELEKRLKGYGDEKARLIDYINKEAEGIVKEDINIKAKINRGRKITRSDVESILASKGYNVSPFRGDADVDAAIEKARILVEARVEESWYPGERFANPGAVEKAVDEKRLEEIAEITRPGEGGVPFPLLVVTPNKDTEGNSVVQYKLVTPEMNKLLSEIVALWGRGLKDRGVDKISYRLVISSATRDMEKIRELAAAPGVAASLKSTHGTGNAVDVWLDWFNRQAQNQENKDRALIEQHRDALLKVLEGLKEKNRINLIYEYGDEVAHIARNPNPIASPLPSVGAPVEPKEPPGSLAIAISLNGVSNVREEFANKVILDVGAGRELEAVSYLRDELEGTGSEVYALDIALPDTNEARKRREYFGFAQRMPSEWTDKFDAIVSTAFFNREVFYDAEILGYKEALRRFDGKGDYYKRGEIRQCYEAIVNEIARVLKRGGAFYIAEGPDGNKEFRDVILKDRRFKTVRDMKGIYIVKRIDEHKKQEFIKLKATSRMAPERVDISKLTRAQSDSLRKGLERLRKDLEAAAGDLREDDIRIWRDMSELAAFQNGGIDLDETALGSALAVTLSIYHERLHDLLRGHRAREGIPSKEEEFYEEVFVMSRVLEYLYSDKVIPSEREAYLDYLETNPAINNANFKHMAREYEALPAKEGMPEALQRKIPLLIAKYAKRAYARDWGDELKGLSLDLRKRDVRAKILTGFGKFTATGLLRPATFGGETRNDGNAEVRKLVEDLKSGKDVSDEALDLVDEIVFKIKGFHLEPEAQRGGAKALVDGKMLELRTGGGKTVTIEAAALLRVLMARLAGADKKGVLVTVPLAKLESDAKDAAAILGALGVKVGYVAKEDGKDAGYLYSYDSAGSLVPTKVSIEEVYQYAEVIYGELQSFVHRYNQELLALDLSERIMSKRRYYLLIDEVDQSLIYEFHIPFVVSGGTQLDDAALRNELRRLINDAVKDDILGDKSLYSKDDSQESVTLQNPKKIKALLDERLKERGDLKRLSEDFWEEYIGTALKAHLYYAKEKRYIVEKGGIVLLGEYTHEKKTGMVLGQGLHQAVEAKENIEKMTAETYTTMTTTVRAFVNDNNIIEGFAGASGTIDRNFIKEIYEKETIAPITQGTERKDMPTNAFLDSASKEASYIERVLSLYEEDRSSIVKTENTQEAELLQERLIERGVNPHDLNIVTALTIDKIDGVLDEAGHTKKITIITNIASRGIDIRLSEALRDKGGLYAIATYFDEFEAFDFQFRGRVARRGYPGVWEAFISLEDNIFTKYSSTLAETRGVLTKLITRYGGRNPDELTAEERAQLDGVLTKFREQIKAHFISTSKAQSEFEEKVNARVRDLLKIREMILADLDGYLRKIGVDTSKIPSDIRQNLRDILLYTLNQRIGKFITELETRRRQISDIMKANDLTGRIANINQKVQELANLESLYTFHLDASVEEQALAVKIALKQSGAPEAVKETALKESRIQKIKEFIQRNLPRAAALTIIPAFAFIFYKFGIIALILKTAGSLSATIALASPIWLGIIALSAVILTIYLKPYINRISGVERARIAVETLAKGGRVEGNKPFIFIKYTLNTVLLAISFIAPIMAGGILLAAIAYPMITVTIAGISLQALPLAAVVGAASFVSGALYILINKSSL